MLSSWLGISSAEDKDDDYEEERRRDDADDDGVVWFSNKAVIGAIRQ